MWARGTPRKALSVILSLQMEPPQWGCEGNTDSQKNCVIHKLVFGTKVQFFEYIRGTSSDFGRRMKLEGCEVQKAKVSSKEKNLREIKIQGTAIHLIQTLLLQADLLFRFLARGFLPFTSSTPFDSLCEISDLSRKISVVMFG